MDLGGVTQNFIRLTLKKPVISAGLNSHLNTERKAN